MARKGAKKITDTVAARWWNVGDRVRVVRQLKAPTAKHIGLTGEVIHVSPYAAMYNGDGMGRVFKVRLDAGHGEWYFGSGALEPERGAANW